MNGGSENEDPITEINVTPLVDVSLVLVIIFMAVAPFAMQAGIKAADARGGAAKGKSALEENVTLDLDEAGNVKINGKPQAWLTFTGALQDAILRSKDRTVTVNASKAAQVGRVVELLDLSKQNGAKKLVIMRASDAVMKAQKK